MSSSLANPEDARAAFVAARAAWPGLQVAEDLWLDRYRSLTATAGEPLSLEVNDLYLATAALQGDAAAQQQLHHLLTAQLKKLLHFRLSRDEQEDVSQSVFTLLLSPMEGKARLASYAARCPLSAWLHVLITRHVLDRLKAQRRALPADEDVLLGLPEGIGGRDSPVDGELDRRRHLPVVGTAFRQAIAGLTSRQRNLLRQHYLDDLSLEDLAAMYRVHRATVSRWIKEARESLLMATRQRLAEALPVGEVDGIVDTVRSRLDLSASFFLSTRLDRLNPS